MTDDLKKRLKEAADKISNSKSAQNITTQTPKPTITPKTTMTNKTGIAKNETIPNPPKSRLISRSDDDLLKNWNHRAFLEGFYEVDGTTNDWEREKRMSLVDEALKDIEERNRKTNKTPGFANYANASNTATTAGGATRPPTQEELEAAYADMQQELSGKNTGKHLNGAAEYVINAVTPQNSANGTAQTPATANTQNKSRDERDVAVRNNYRARQQSEADARYEDFDIEAAERKLYDSDYWINRLYESRRQGYSFPGDERIVEERWELEREIKRAKEAAQRRRERYVREKAAEMPQRKAGDMLRWSSGNMPERGQNTFAVNPRYANTLYPETQPGFYNGTAQKNYYPKERSIYGEHTDEALDTMSNILTAASLIPGIDTFADAAAIPVDLLRGDYISAGLDAFGVIPFIGEVADTAKLVRTGVNIADAAHDAGKVIDASKIADKADDVADVMKTENNVGELAKPYPKENLPKEIKDWIEKLPRYMDSIETSSAPSYEQISLLSRQEGVEFASITIGNRNIIIRGDTNGTAISKELLEDMIRNKGILNCHSHPYIGDLQPSKSDLWLAQILGHQEEFEIITPDNMKAVYTKHGIKSVGNIERKLSEQDVLELYKLFGG